MRGNAVEELPGTDLDYWDDDDLQKAFEHDMDITSPKCDALLGSPNTTLRT